MKKIEIPSELYPYFKNIGHTIKYLKGETIYIQGETATNLYLIIKGRVRVYYISKNGEEATLEIIVIIY